MITLRRLNGTEFVLNCELIETVEAKPDTTIRLNDGNLYIVAESVDEVVAATLAYKQSWFAKFLRKGDEA